MGSVVAQHLDRRLNENGLECELNDLVPATPHLVVRARRSSIDLNQPRSSGMEPDSPRARHVTSAPSARSPRTIARPSQPVPPSTRTRRMRPVNRNREWKTLCPLPANPTPPLCTAPGNGTNRRRRSERSIIASVR